MIEPTGEMRQAFREAPGVGKACGCSVCLNHRLAAVLAIVERDYDVTPKAPPVEHRARGEAWWNHYMEQYEAECVCGETFADGRRGGAVDRLMDHLDRQP